MVRGLKNVRLGAIGARPTAFNTVRYSEKLLERSGITVETLDLSEVMGRIGRMADNDDAAQAKLAAIRKYIPVGSTPEAALMKMAKLGAVIDHWMKASELTVSAVQCWTSIEEYLGIVPCTVMSMMSENLIPSACEVDVLGTLSMYALTLASETPSALLDWNNNYGDNPDKAVCFHCSNLPKHFFKEGVKMDYQLIIAGTVGKENTHGTLDGTVKAGPMSFARFSTDDFGGTIKRLRRRGRVHQRPAEHLWRSRRGRDPQLCSSCCTTSARTASNTTSPPASPPPRAPVHWHEAMRNATQRYLNWPMHWHK
jgi:L-fucose isomerase-like protein